jgi:hypothetical protein
MPSTPQASVTLKNDLYSIGPDGWLRGEHGAVPVASIQQVRLGARSKAKLCLVVVLALATIGWFMYGLYSGRTATVMACVVAASIGCVMWDKFTERRVEVVVGHGVVAISGYMKPATARKVADLLSRQIATDLQPESLAAVGEQWCKDFVPKG